MNDTEYLAAISSPLERRFALSLMARCGRALLPVTQHRFHATRRWRFDFAWPSLKLAVEIQGGTWIRGRHARGSGIQQDAEKLNAAQRAGWCVLLFTGADVESGRAIEETMAELRHRLVAHR